MNALRLILAILATIQEICRPPAPTVDDKNEEFLAIAAHAQLDQRARFFQYTVLRDIEEGTIESMRHIDLLTGAIMTVEVAMLAVFITNAESFKHANLHLFTQLALSGLIVGVIELALTLLREGLGKIAIFKRRWERDEDEAVEIIVEDLGEAARFNVILVRVKVCLALSSLILGVVALVLPAWPEVQWWK